MHYFSLFFKRE